MTLSRGKFHLLKTFPTSQSLSFELVKKDNLYFNMANLLTCKQALWRAPELRPETLLKRHATMHIINYLTMQL